MKQTFACTILAVFLSVSAFGQSTEGSPAFEVADVHVSPRSTSLFMQTSIRAGRYELRNATMVDLIQTAYTIDADKVLEGPAWLEYDRFDVLAKIPSKVPPQETLKLMLQVLLADRFKLVLHKDTKPIAGFVLSLGKGKPKLKEARPSAETGCKSQPQAAPGRTSGVLNSAMTVYACRKMTMGAFAGALLDLSDGYVNNAVVDSTGLKGSWDFELKFTPHYASLGSGSADGMTLFDAIDKQLGLKLQERKIPTPVIVVDRVNQKPTDNPPDLVTKFPPDRPMGFEVADIKPSGPDSRGGTLFIRAEGDRVNLRRLSLMAAIRFAWNISDNDIVGAPKWLNSAPFDIVAKLPAAVLPANGTVVLQEDLRTMMQALLIDRFKMKVHYEDRPVKAYTLVAAKPKLKKANPSGRTGCKTGIAPGAPGANAVSTPFEAGFFSVTGLRLATCRNISMAQFADELRNFGSAYVSYPVLDKTGLDGAWDFTFTYSPIPPAQLNGLRGTPPTGGAGDPGASDPVGGISLFDAVEKQLGLKLEMQKRPYPQLVIDHIEEKPTDN